MLDTNEYGEVINCYHSAMAVREDMFDSGAIAVPLNVGRGTLYHISFVNLKRAVPFGVCSYCDGSNYGIQINIDRKSCYAMPEGSVIQEWRYLAENWNLGRVEAELLLPFFNTVFTGENYFVTKTEE